MIGITGLSCSGKTTLARCLAQTLPGTTTLLSLDSYYRDFARLPPAEKARINFDAPAALDLELLTGDLEKLARGEGVERPVYLFPTHARAARTERVEPGDCLIVEGLFALYWARIRRLYRARVFVEAADRICLERRLARDMAERGRTRESILNQYASQVRPMGERHVLPTRGVADVVVDGQAPVEEGVAAVCAYLHGKPS